jgi:hypothetical protein
MWFVRVTFIKRNLRNALIIIKNRAKYIHETLTKLKHLSKLNSVTFSVKRANNIAKIKHRTREKMHPPNSFQTPNWCYDIILILFCVGATTYLLILTDNP